MPRISVKMLFDDETEQKIALRRHSLTAHAPALADTDQQIKYPPHVTLAVYDVAEMDIPAYATRIPALTASWHRFLVLLETLGIFTETRVLFLAPRVSQTLLHLHQATFELFSTPVVDELLLPDRWTPHVTLAAASSAEELPGMLAQELRAWSPIRGEAIGVGLLVHPSVTHYERSLFAKLP